MLRAVQLGLSISDMNLLTLGLVMDMVTESANDEYKGYRQIANQDDFDKF